MLRSVFLGDGPRLASSVKPLVKCRVKRATRSLLHSPSTSLLYQVHCSTIVLDTLIPLPFRPSCRLELAMPVMSDESNAGEAIHVRPVKGMIGAAHTNSLLANGAQKLGTNRYMLSPFRLLICRPVTDKIEAEKAKRHLTKKAPAAASTIICSSDAIGSAEESPYAPSEAALVPIKGSTVGFDSIDCNYDYTMPDGGPSTCSPNSTLEQFFNAMMKESSIPLVPMSDLALPRHSHTRSLNLLKTVFATNIDLFMTHLYPLHPIVSQISLYERFRAGVHLTDPSFASLLCAISATVNLLPDTPCDNQSMGDDFHSLAVDLQREGDQGEKYAPDLPSLDQLAASMLIDGYSSAINTVVQREQQTRKSILLVQRLKEAREQNRLCYDATELEIVTIMLWKAAVWDR